MRQYNWCVHLRGDFLLEAFDKLLLDADDESLAQMAQNSNRAAEEILIKRFSPLVKFTARMYCLRGAESEDLNQEGMVGLLFAIRDYSKEKSPSFGAFARICIKGKILSAVKSSMRRKHSPLNNYVSLSNPVSDEYPGYPVDMIAASQSFEPEFELLKKDEFDRILESANNKLSRYERKVLSFYLEGLTCREIGQILEKDSKSVDNAVSRIKAKISALK